MRKMLDSGKCACSVWLSARADARSRPKGFSTTMRAPAMLPVALRCSATVANMLGGMAR
jgi:hypothetical protein